MPYIRIYSPELTLRVKRELAHSLTENLVQVLQLSDEARHRTFVQFIPYSLEDMAIAGSLLVHTLDPEYQIEVHERNLTPASKEALVSSLTAAFSEGMRLQPEQAFKIHILFRDYSNSDMAIGGRFISDLDKDLQQKEA